jgi:hypothetical protein
VLRECPAVLLGLDVPGHRKPQLRPLRETFGELVQLDCFGRIELLRAGRESNGIQSTAFTAADQPRYQIEGRADRLDDEVSERLPHQPADTEARFPNVAFHFEPEIDHALAVLQKRKRQTQRQIDGLGTCHALAELHLVHHDVVVTD